MGLGLGAGDFCVPLTLGTLILDSRACFEGQTSSPLFHSQGCGLSFSQVPSCPPFLASFHPGFLACFGELGEAQAK